MPSSMTWEYSSSKSDFDFQPFIVAKNIITDSSQVSKELIPIALTLSRSRGNKEQRIMLCGDADFISNKEMSRKNVSNLNDYGLVPTMFYWLSNYEFPVDVTPIRPVDDHLNLPQEDKLLVKTLKGIYMGLIPAILLLVGSYVLVSRKRK